MYTNIIICVLGILVNTFGCAFNLFMLNIAGCVLCAIAAFRLKSQSSLLKKVKTYSVLSIPGAVFAFLLTLVKIDDMNMLYCVSLGINTFFFIYFTYYLTSMLIDHAKGISELAATRNLLSVWILCGIVSFLYFMAFSSSLIPGIMNIAKIILLVAVLYYAFAVTTAAITLFPKEK